MGRGGLNLIEALLHIRCPDPYIQILEIKQRVSEARDLVICHHDVLDVFVDKVVEAVDVLLYQALDGQEGGDQLPFLLHGLD